MSNTFKHAHSSLVHVSSGLKPTDIDILITNTSIYCPTPSISALVVNMFRMRDDIESYRTAQAVQRAVMDVTAAQAARAGGEGRE